MQSTRSRNFKALSVAMVTAVITVTVSGCSVFGTKAANEPESRIVEKDGNVEIRRYAAYVVAETTVSGAYDTAVNTGFRRLFKYISGANRRSQKVSP